MSQEQLAMKIFKSKSTLSKYESGKIPIDIETLYLIASELEVEMSSLVDYAIPSKTQMPLYRDPFDNSDRIYMYYFDGRSNRTTKHLSASSRDSVTAIPYPAAAIWIFLPLMSMSSASIFIPAQPCSTR